MSKKELMVVILIISGILAIGTALHLKKQSDQKKYFTVRYNIGEITYKKLTEEKPVKENGCYKFTTIDNEEYNICNSDFSIMRRK